MRGEFKYRKARIAPTPSGYLHLGNVLSFAITSALAREANAKLFLRIDDVDRERTNKLYVQDIFDTLNFLEIPWDEGPRNMKEYEQEYSQVHRMGIYGAALERLKERGCLFACPCYKSDIIKLNKDNIYSGTCRNRNLPFDRDNISWRINTSENKELSVKVFGGEIIKTTLPASMTDFVVRKRDGFPAYQLISLIDDMHFGIDLIVRGDDLWASTLAQQYLSLQLGLGLADTVFFHHPLLMDAAGKKLSKSTGATSVYHFRKDRKSAKDIYAFISRILGAEDPAANWQELLLQLKGIA